MNKVSEIFSLRRRITMAKKNFSFLVFLVFVAAMPASGESELVDEPLR